MSRAVGRDAVRGDPAAVRHVADVFDAVASEAESVLTRLRNVGTATGEECWRGDAATAFRARLDELGPGIRRLIDAHHEARNALWGYADALRQAQESDRKAEGDAASAVRDRDRAATDRHAASEQAFGSEAAARAAGAAAKEAHLLQFTASASGQVQWHSQLVAYERQQTVAQQKAQRTAAEARGKERAAAQLENAAKARLAAATVLAEQAAFTREVSAHQTVRRLDEAGRTGLAGRNPIEQAWEGVCDKVNGFASSPEFLAALDALDNASTALTVIGFALLFCGPVGIVVGGVLLAISDIPNGVVFVGTLLAFLNHKKSLGDLTWSALGLIPGVKAGEKGAKAGKTVLKEWGGVVKRSLYYDDARKAHILRDIHVAPKLKGFEKKLVRTLPLDPQVYYGGRLILDTVTKTHDVIEKAKHVIRWSGSEKADAIRPIIRPIPVPLGPIRDVLPPPGPVFHVGPVGRIAPDVHFDQKVSP